MDIARHVFVSGLVQGVAFRYHARERARELGVAGWVRNLSDGRVEARFEGPEERVEAFLAWLRHGPRAALVTECEVREREPAGDEGFRIVS